MLLSNGFHHSENLPVKFGFSPKNVPANIAKKLPPQRCFKPLFIPVFNFSHKRSTFAFTGESGYTLGFRRRIAYNGLHVETGAFPPPATARSCAASEIATERTAGRSGCTPVACVRFLRRRGPAGLRNLFPLLLKLHFCAPHSGLSTLARCGGVTTALGMLGALPKCSVRRFQSGLHLLPQSGVSITYLPSLKESHTTSHTLKERAFPLRPQLSSDLPSDFYKYVNCINNSACRFCCNCFCCMVR